MRDHTISEDSVPYSPTVSSGYHTDERNSAESLARPAKAHVTFEEEVEEFRYRDMSQEEKVQGSLSMVFQRFFAYQYSDHLLRLFQ